MKITNLERKLLVGLHTKARNLMGRKFILTKELSAVNPSLLRTLERYSSTREVPLYEAAHIALHGSRPRCLHCSKPLTMIESFKKGFGEFCSRQCSCKSSRKASRTVSTNLEKYGVSNVSQVSSVKRKRTKTILFKYGVPNAFMAAEVKQTIKQSCLERYGVTHPMKDAEVAARAGIWMSDPTKMKARNAKINSTVKKRYGVEWASQIPEAKQKRILTMDSKPDSFWEERRQRLLATWDSKSNEQLSEDLHKRLTARYGRKEFSIDGHTFEYQGYEHHAIRFLVNNVGIKPEKILSGSQVPTVNIEFGRFYLPDLKTRIAGVDCLVEVKSTYTAGFQTPAMFKSLKRKAKAVELDTDCEFVLLVFNHEGVLLAHAVGSSFTLASLKRQARTTT